MWLVIVGVLLLLAKLAELGPFGGWPWYVVLAPFVGAILWWQFADSSGWTQRRAIDKMERRKEERREKAMDALGLSRRRERQITRAQRDAARRTSSVDPTHVDTRPPEESRRDPRL